MLKVTDRTLGFTMTNSTHFYIMLMTCVAVLCLQTQITQSVPADRYMPPSWIKSCLAEVSPYTPPSSASYRGPEAVNNVHPSLGSLQNPFLKPSNTLRNNNNMPSYGSNTGENMETTVPTDLLSSSNSLDQIPPSTSADTALTSRTKLNNITCKISKMDDVHWKLMDLHDWQISNGVNAVTTPSNRTVVFSISVECETGANISLPWPMKTKGLQEVRVKNCGLVDQFALANNPLVSLIPDELRVLDIRDSFWLVDLNSENSILENTATDFINLHSDYDCGQDASLEIYISRNVTFTSHDVFNGIGMNSTEDQNVKNETSLSDGHTTKRPIKPEDRLITNKEALISDKHDLEWGSIIPNLGDLILGENNASDNNDNITNLTAKQDFFELLKKIKNTRIKCDFVKLLVRDESLSSDTPRHLLEVSTQEATHPVLEVLNYSRIGMLEFPRELSQWRLYFPRLVYLDLSYNHISELKVENYPLMPGTPRTVMNIRHNNVTKLTPEILTSWASVDRFHIDIMHNPISCDCNIKPLILFFQDELTFTGNIKQYEYVKYLHCNTPDNLKGRKLGSLAIDELPCPSFESSSNVLLIALAVLLGAFLILTIILIRFKVEIRILLYTRLHVRLPCDSDAQRNNKLYDAFVSYSNEDSNWVLQNLVSYLEKDTTCNLNGGLHSQKGVQKYANSPVWSHNGNSASGTMRTKSREDHNGFKLCLHQRDFIPGKTIVDNIIDSIEASRHTIIVLSPSFMRSHWAMEELRQAYRQSLVEKTRHLIVVLLEKVPDEDMDPLIRRCVKTFTYLEVQDSIFRDKLVFSLSTKDRATRRRDRIASKQMTASYSLSNGSSNNNSTTAHENFTYLHDTPHTPSSPSNAERSNQRASNEYETIQIPASTSSCYSHSPSSSASGYKNGKAKTNTHSYTGKEIIPEPDYYSFPSKKEEFTSPSPSDNGYYSLELPSTNSPPSPQTGNYDYENPVNLNFRPDGPARVLSNSSTCSTTALTWNL